MVTESFNLDRGRIAPERKSGGGTAHRDERGWGGEGRIPHRRNRRNDRGIIRGEGSHFQI